MEAPMSGGTPRRPHTLRINEKNLHKLLARSKAALNILKVALSPQALGDWDPTKHDRQGEGVQAEGHEGLGAVPFSMRWPPTRYCHVCKKRSFPSQLKSCSQCKAVLYCSDQCSHSDRTRCPQDASHEHWCAKLATHMSHAAELADLPFTYTDEVTADNFELEHFLSQNQLTSGYWHHWSLLVRSPRYELHPIGEPPKDPYSHWLAGHSEPCGPLRLEGELLLNGPGPHTAPALNKPLGSWRQYYEWRGLGVSSLVTPLLSSTLSVYHIITALVPKHFPELNILKKQSLKIHIIESSREFHTLLMFWELSMLLPHVTFELVFIGEGLPSWSDEEQLVMQKKNGCVTLLNPRLTPGEPVDKRSIRVKCYRRAYYMLQGPKPDLVIGFRPAIPLHESWLSTLPRLQSLRVPAYFCELTELSCECSQQVMSQATGGGVSPAHINPFHCPLRIAGGDNMLPWYSNALIFHLVYKPVANFIQRPAPANAEVPPPQVQPDNPSPEAPKMNRKERKQAARHQQLKKRK
ncbi:zinc finger MYND domain-containing protein 15-like [Aplochiton taeniatus]